MVKCSELKLLNTDYLVEIKKEFTFFYMLSLISFDFLFKIILIKKINSLYLLYESYHRRQ